MQVIKPDFTTSIVQVRAGEVIPDTMLHKLISENRSAIGLVVQDNKKLEVEKFATLSTIEKDFEAIKSIVTNTKKFQRMFCFSQFPAEFDEDEVQPWSIIKDSKGNRLLCVAVDGDLPGRSVDGDSEMLGTLNDYLGPKIEALYKLLGNDTKKLFAAMRDKTFGDDLLNIIGHRGHFFFMPVEGDVFAHGKEPELLPLNGSYSWGSASLAYGYTESVMASGTPAKAEITPPAPGVGRSKYASDIHTDENGIHNIPEKKAEPEPKPAADPPKADPKPVTDPIEKVAEDVVKGHMEAPPSNLHGKALKKWYRDMDPEGKLVQDWAKKPAVWIEHKTTVTALADLNQTAVANIQKVEQPKAVLPVVDGKTQAAGKEFIAKYLDGASNEVDNPLEMQKQEAQLAVFSELVLKGNLDQIERWKTSGVLAFIKAHPELAWLLVLELRADRIKRKQTMALGDKKLGELAGTADVTKTQPPALPQTTETQPSPAPAPAAPAEQPEVRKSKYA
jgi:hypothetical protein